MKYTDSKLTASISEWLNTSVADRDVRVGADMMLALNRNRALYNTVLRNPEKFMPKLEYELRKYLRLRLDSKSVADAERMEATVMPRIAEIVAEAPEISSDDELPEPVIAKGRRADHESLPAHIQALWDSNGRRYQRMVILFNELKNMADALPCDRYEKLCILGELDSAYRKNLELYDSFVAPPAKDDALAEDCSGCTDDATAVADAASADNIVKAVNAARKTISKYRKMLSGMSDDDPKRQSAIAKLQEAANVIQSSGSGLADDTKNDLRALGISL